MVRAWGGTSGRVRGRWAEVWGHGQVIQSPIPPPLGGRPGGGRSSWLCILRRDPHEHPPSQPSPEGGRSPFFDGTTGTEHPNCNTGGASPHKEDSHPRGQLFPVLTAETPLAPSALLGTGRLEVGGGHGEPQLQWETANEREWTQMGAWRFAAARPIRGTRTALPCRANGSWSGHDPGLLAVLTELHGAPRRGPSPDVLL